MLATCSITFVFVGVAQGRTALHHAAAAGSTAKVHLKHNEDVCAFYLDPQVSLPTALPDCVATH